MIDELPISDLYETLGVESDATGAVIKRAFFRLVRTHTPEENPVDFQRLHSAYLILSDTTRRRSYDQMRRYGTEINRRMEEANQIIDEDPRRATRLLKEILIMTPDAHEPRLLLSKAFLRLGEYQHAELELKRLAGQRPKDALLRYELAYCLWMQERGPEALHETERALRIDPLFHDALMLRAHIFQARRETSRAVEALETAIGLDGKESYNDYPALLRLLGLYAVEEDEAQVRRVGERLRRVLPVESPELIAEGVGRIHALAWDFFENRNYLGAYRIIGCATHRLLQDTELLAQIAESQAQMKVAAEAAELAQDKRISGALHMFVCGKYLSTGVVREATQNAKAHEAMTERVLEEARRNPGPYRLMLDHVVARYPIVSSAESELISRAYSVAASTANADSENIPPARTSPSGPPNAGAYIPRGGVLSAAKNWMRRREP